MLKKRTTYLQRLLGVIIAFLWIAIMPVQSFGQALNKITGKVTDGQTKESLFGVSVKIKGTNKGVSTDNKGQFNITVKDNDVLVFSHIGYENQEVGTKGKTSIDILLAPAAADLNNVVVNVGYGSARKKDLTGSVGQANVGDMAKAPVASFDQALAGRMAGVQVSSSDGQPGSEGISIVVRGANSLTQSNAPLYVIDGFPIVSPDNGALNPNDIASITVLKDASATAIYGSRGANGVIIIETKKGKNGAPIVTYNGSFGGQKVVKKMDMMSAYDFVKYQNELNPTTTATTYFGNGKTLDSYKNVSGINWQDQLFRTSQTMIHNLAVRGGNDKTLYSISGSIFDQNAIIINSGYTRYQGRVSIDQTVDEKLKVGMNINYSAIGYYGQQASEETKSNSSTSALLYGVWGYRPVSGSGDNSSLLDDVVDDAVDPQTDYRINPIISAQNEYRHTDIKNMLSNAYIRYNFSKKLTLNITGGYNNRMMKNGNFFNSLTSRGTPLIPSNTKGSNGSIYYNERNTLSNENTLTYKTTINKNHQLDALVGYSQQSIHDNTDGFAASQVPNESLGINGLANGVDDGKVTLDSRSTLQSVLGRINYGYKSKYLLTASFRTDGSSKFANGHKWGYFPSAAVAWRMSDENFLKNSKVISNAKLRLSYGLTGNNGVGDFSYLPVVAITTISNYSFQNATPTQGLAVSSLGNSDLKWETTGQSDLGFDISFLNNRIDFSADIYRKTTKDLLLLANLPPSSGYINAYKNIGSVQNQGLEITINTVNINTPNFKWESNFNISFNASKILGLNEGQDQIQSGVTWETNYNASSLYLTKVGQPLSQFFGYVFDGIYQNSDFNISPSGNVVTLKPNLSTNGNTRATIRPGDIKYKDLNGDGVITAADQTVIGRATPIHTGGFSNNFSYKGFSLNMLLQWSYGNNIFNANRLLFDGNSRASYNLNQYASYNNRWTPDNPSNTEYRTGGQGPLGYYSSRVLEDGSFLKLKTVSLSYNIPAKFIKKMKINSLSVSATAQNLYTFTKYTGMDPEVSVKNSALTPGFDYSAYPYARTLVFGLNVSF
jgi:TonB-linked SusC/RagA family outer membrane protein